MRSIHKTLTVGLVLTGLMLAVSACTVRHTVSVGSHHVKVTRHGLEKKFYVSTRNGVAVLDYAGISPDGKGLKVSIQGDQVKINDVDSGRLRPGDSVLISDDGVAVNAMDYGESAKYLRENGTGTDTSALNKQ